MDGRRQPTEADQHVPLDINTTWLESIKYTADMSLRGKPPAEPTIFRAPPGMRCGNPGAYEPKLVSIGPYHRDKKELKAMEGLKWRLLHHYLSKVPNGGNNEGLRKMKDLENRARDCYSEVIDMDSDQFVKMLLLDGCFLVQIFITCCATWHSAKPDEYTYVDNDLQAEELNDLQAEELNDLLGNNLWFSGLIPQDLLLLENQLPYFVVEHLLETLVRSGWNSSCLKKVAISWFAGLLPQYSNFPDTKLSGQSFEVNHLLHLFHHWILSVPKLEKASNTRSCTNLLPWCCNFSLSEGLPCFTEKKGLPPTTAPTTTELAEAGVEIKMRKYPARNGSCPAIENDDQTISFLDISFCKDRGVLEIPAIKIDDATNMVLANLIALEQCCPKVGLDITHYTLFLDDIINTPRDVKLLHQERIIHRNLGADEDIASLFNKLGSGVNYDPEQNYLQGVYEDLNAYCQSRCHRWRAKAVRDYFGNPWAIISLGAAVLLLGLTILQSVYGVLDYYKK